MAAFPQAHLAQEFVGAGAGLGDAGQLEGQEHVFAGGLVRQQLEALENETQLAPAQERQLIFAEVFDGFAVKGNRARARRIEAGHQGQQGRFAAAGGPEDGHHLAARNFEIDMVEDGKDPIPGRQLLDQLVDADTGLGGNAAI